MLGGSGDDTLDGGEGDDLLNGGIGDDVIDGGEGMDALVYNGTYGENTISIVDGVMTVTGPDGTDTVENVENFFFNNSPTLLLALKTHRLTLHWLMLFTTPASVFKLKPSNTTTCD